MSRAMMGKYFYCTIKENERSKCFKFFICVFSVLKGLKIFNPIGIILTLNNLEPAAKYGRRQTGRQTDSETWAKEFFTISFLEFLGGHNLAQRPKWKTNRLGLLYEQLTHVLCVHVQMEKCIRLDRPFSDDLLLNKKVFSPQLLSRDWPHFHPFFTWA